MTGDRVYVLTRTNFRDYNGTIIGVFSDVDEIKSFLRKKHQDYLVQAIYSGLDISFNVYRDYPEDVYGDMGYEYDAEPAWINKPIK